MAASQDSNSTQDLEYSDKVEWLIITASDGYECHMLPGIIEQMAPHLFDHAKTPDRIELPDSGPVVRTMTSWLITAPWPDLSGVVNVGTEIVTLLGLAEAAEKYELPRLRNESMIRAQLLIATRFDHYKQALNVIRDLFPRGKSAAGEVIGELAREVEGLVVAQTNQRVEQLLREPNLGKRQRNE